MSVSSRVKAADSAVAFKRFYFDKRRLADGVCDLTFGNPHELPLLGVVKAIRECAIPHDKTWYAYKASEEEPQAFLAEHVARELGLAFEPEDIALTTGAFAAIMVAVHQTLDAGD
jgi:aspartate aminotransferase